MQDRITIANESMDSLRFSVEIDVATDFADIFDVKGHDFALGDPVHAPPLPPQAPAVWSADGRDVSFESGDDRARVAFSRPGDRGRWEVELGPRERWDLVVDVFPHGDSLPHDVGAGDASARS